MGKHVTLVTGFSNMPSGLSFLDREAEESTKHKRPKSKQRGTLIEEVVKDYGTQSGDESLHTSDREFIDDASIQSVNSSNSASTDDDEDEPILIKKGKRKHGGEKNKVSKKARRITREERLTGITPIKRKRHHAKKEEAQEHRIKTKKRKRLQMVSSSSSSGDSGSSSSSESEETETDSEESESEARASDDEGKETFFHAFSRPIKERVLAFPLSEVVVSKKHSRQQKRNDTSKKKKKKARAKKKRKQRKNGEKTGTRRQDLKVG